MNTNNQYIYDALKHAKMPSTYMNGVRLTAMDMVSKQEKDLVAVFCGGASSFAAIRLPEAFKRINKALLSGASDWVKYAKGGCGLISTYDILHRYGDGAACIRYTCCDGSIAEEFSSKAMDVEAEACMEARSLIFQTLYKAFIYVQR